MMNQKKSPTIINYLVIVFYLAMVGVNALANILPINGITTGEVSDSYPNLFAPAGLTFSIWGVIYLLLGIYSVYQLLDYRKTRDNSKARLLNRIGFIFILSCLANIGWILAWHNLWIGISTILIFFLLICLIVINQMTKKTSQFTNWEKILIRVPFSIYFGWITVASIANVTTLLVDLNWNGWGFSEQAWTIVILLVGLVIALVTMISNRDIIYGLTVIWAYLGIAIKHYSTSGFNGEYPPIIVTVVVSMLVLLIGGAYALFKRKKKQTVYY